MSKEMIISVNGREKKIAIIEDDVVTEFYVERGDENQGIVGNIYKGKVMKVLPGMQSAFVDIGLERDSFLYVSDFFDEDVDEDEEEVRKEIARPQALPQKIERPARRETARLPVIEPEEEEEEAEIDLHAAALRHIAEIAEEPIIEPAEDEEPPAAPSVRLPLLPKFAADSEDESTVEAKEGGRGPRQRRQRRLRYNEPETPAPTEEETETVGAEQAEEEIAAVEETEFTAETEAEDTSGRRGRGRSRGRGRGRGRGGDPAEAEPVERAPKTATEEEEPKAHAVLVHHEPLERVTDDDIEFAGDMLKDAMMQERISGWIHEEERRTALLELEPTPEVHVGSLQHALNRESGFERISDSEDPAAEAGHQDSSDSLGDSLADSLTEAPAIDPILDWVNSEKSEAKYEAVTEPFFGWSEEGEAEPSVLRGPVTDAAKSLTPHQHDEHGLTHHVVEVGDDVEVLHLNPPAIEFAEATEVGNAQEPESSVNDAESQKETAEEELPREELKDASAKVRQRPRRGEMATRRGGRGRKRTFRQRGAANDATSDAEDNQDEEDEKPVSAPSPVSAPAPPARLMTDRFQRPVISDLLREGQEIIVQIAKEPIGQKGARITSHVALPGRYIVYMPTVDHIGVSRKIGTDEERQRLRRTLQQLRAEAGAGGGFIVRTAANGCTLEELREDMQYLIRTWTDIRRRSEKAKSPAIVHRDLDLVQRILRDQVSSDYTAIRVDNEFEYERIVDFVNRFAPKLVHRVKLYTKDTPILENYGVQPEIDKAVKPRVWLRSGGYIVINQTEALVAIDVNTGKFVGKSNRLEDTITKTNLEAAKEIVRQIRLRDLGGIIVLDFIDMEERRNRAKVMAALEQEIRSDRSPSKILQFNDFGLVAVTRKRVKQSLERTLCTPCAYCGGGGMVKSAQTICYEILAEARRISKDVEDHNEIILRINPEVVKALRGAERDVLTEIEAYLGVVTIKSDPTVHQEQFDIALA